MAGSEEAAPAAAAGLPSSSPSCRGVAALVVGALSSASSASSLSSLSSSSCSACSLWFVGASRSSAGVLALRTSRREVVAVMELSCVLRGRMIILPLVMLFFYAIKDGEQEMC
jgi:hypothetical protein